LLFIHFIESAKGMFKRHVPCDLSNIENNDKIENVAVGLTEPFHERYWKVQVTVHARPCPLAPASAKFNI
jgi:hypothetical protein